MRGSFDEICILCVVIAFNLRVRVTTKLCEENAKTFDCLAKTPIFFASSGKT